MRLIKICVVHAFKISIKRSEGKYKIKIDLCRVKNTILI